MCAPSRSIPSFSTCSCANSQGSDGKWNKFGGRLAWDASAICSNNPSFGGRGNPKQGDDYAAAPNIDHSQERIRNVSHGGGGVGSACAEWGGLTVAGMAGRTESTWFAGCVREGVLAKVGSADTHSDASANATPQDIVQWMKYLRNSIGFDGWRFDFVRGYLGSYCKQYIDETVPAMAFGEYWDSCEYTDGVLNYNQVGQGLWAEWAVKPHTSHCEEERNATLRRDDLAGCMLCQGCMSTIFSSRAPDCFRRLQDAHRQRTVNWCDSTGGTSAAFDFTTKGILQEAVGRREYWRLVDSQVGTAEAMWRVLRPKAVAWVPDSVDRWSWETRAWPFAD